MAEQPNEILTETGCSILVVPRWDMAKMEFDTHGRVIMRLQMKQPDDGRWAEVMLAPRERLLLGRLLLDQRWSDLIVVGDD